MRFINADSIRAGIDTGESLNRYAYVNGNPVSLVDPFGTSAELANLAHTALDVMGILPGYGMLFDAVNGLWYASESDWINAGIIIASFLPLIGDIGQAGRVSYKTVDLLDDGYDFVKAGRNVGNGIDSINDVVRGGLEVVKPGTKEPLIKYELQFFAKKDIKQIQDIAKQFKMNDITRREFGDYVESLKDLVPNSKNFTYKELEQIAKEFLGVIK